MFKRFLALACLVGMVGCIHATVADTVNVDNTIAFSFPPNLNVPPGVVLPTITQQEVVPVDISDALSKIAKLATISLTVDSSTITYDGSYAPIENVTIHINYGQDMNAIPAELVNYDFSSNEPPTVNIPLLMTGQEIYDILSQGPVNLDVQLTIDPNVGGIPQSGSITVEQHLGLQVSGDISK